MNTLNAANAPHLAGETVSTAVKILDKLDLFENDDLIAALPFGKAVQGTWKLIAHIKDPEKAARHSVGAAVGFCFGAGLLDCGVEKLPLNDSEERRFKQALSEAMEKTPVDLKSFNVGRIHETEVAESFAKIYFRYLTHSRIDDAKDEVKKVQPRLEKFLKLWLTLFWRRVVEQRSDRYAGLEQFLGKESFQLEKQIESLLNYETALANLYLEPTNNEPDISLSDLYIESDCQVLESICQEGRDSNVGESKFWDCDKAGLPDGLHQLVLSWLQGKLDTSALYHQDHRLLLLYGLPGQGKTSFCKRLLYDLIGKEERQERPVYFLRLRKIPNVGRLKAAPLEYLAQVIQKQNGITIEMKDFHQSILILDGMDELAMSTNLTMKESDTVVRELLNEIKNIAGINIIVTSRHGYLNNDSQLRDALVLQINELKRAQQLSWVKTYATFRQESALNEISLASIDASSALGKLITQPILLQLVANLEELPENTSNRAAVYEKVFDHIIEVPWKDKNENIAALQGIDSKRAKKLFRASLQEIAFRMFRDGKEYIPGIIIEEEIEVVKRLMKLLGNEETRDTLKTMYVSFYLREVGMEPTKGYRTEKDQEYGIEFVHKSFGEFLIAEHCYHQLQTIFLATDEYEDYQLTDKRKALQQWNDLMAQRPFSWEIIDYLISIIHNDPAQEQRTVLKDRLQEFAPYFFEQGFLDQQDTKVYEVMGIKRGIASFYVWLVMIGKLDNTPALTAVTPYRTAFIELLKLTYTSGYHRLNLSGANLSGANLSGANLSGANLSGAYLSGANLSGANLSGANLSGAYLSGANLFGAYLFGAYLNGAYLNGAYLSGANLSGAYLRGANLSGADLRGANLRGANNLTSKQLAICTSLYQCKNLSQELKQELLAEGHAHLFEKPKEKEE